MAGSDEDLGRSRRPRAEDWGWSDTARVLDDRTIERLVTPCAIYTVYKEIRRAGFLVWPQNQGRWFPGLGLKSGSSGLVIWASKSPRWFLGLSLKTMLATVCWLRHKTDGRRMTWDTHRDLAAGFAWK
jgi:hypothetical protein